MYLVEPVLIPFVYDELKCLRFLSKVDVRDVDFLIPFNYQEVIFKTLFSHVGSHLLEDCLKDISSAKTMREFYKIINNSFYANYYKYFLVLFVRKKEFSNITSFRFWLKKQIRRNRDFSYLKFYPPKCIYELDRSYNTIFITEIPTYSPIDNYFNRLFGCPPNYYDPREIFRKSVEKLVEGGKIVVIDKISFWKTQTYRSKNLVFVRKQTYEKQTEKEEGEEKKTSPRMGWL